MMELDPAAHPAHRALQWLVQQGQLSAAQANEALAVAHGFEPSPPLLYPSIAIDAWREQWRELAREAALAIQEAQLDVARRLTQGMADPLWARIYCPEAARLHDARLIHVTTLKLP